MEKKIIALDIDDTIFAFMALMLKMINLKHNSRVTVEDITERIPHDNLEDIISEGRWTKEFEFFEQAGAYAAMTPFEGVRTSIENLIAAGYEVVYVTARPSIFKKQTEFSFIVNKIPNVDRIYYAPKGKKRILSRLKPAYFVDDNITNCKDALKAGMTLDQIYVLDQPWNSTEDSKDFKRISSLMQLERMLLDKKND